MANPSASQTPASQTRASRITAEFTIEPFAAAAPGPHVQAAIAVAEDRAAKDTRVRVEVGPFGTSIEGPTTAVLEIVSAVNEAAVITGATRVSLQLTVTPAASD